MVNWKRISIILLFLLAVSVLIIGYAYTINDQTVYHVTYKSITGDPTEHVQVYEVMVFPGVDAEQVNRSLMLCPNVFGYSVIPYDESRFFYTPDWWEWECCPYPNDGETYLILVVDHDQYPGISAGAWTSSPDGRVIVFVRDNWPDMLLSDVITHECCHNIEGDVNIMDYQGVYWIQFSEWLENQWYVNDNGSGINANGMTRLYNDWAIDEILSQSQFLADV